MTANEMRKTLVVLGSIAAATCTLPALAETFDPFGLACETLSGNARIIVNVSAGEAVAAPRQSAITVLWRDVTNGLTNATFHEGTLKWKAVNWPEVNEFGHQVYQHRLVSAETDFWKNSYMGPDSYKYTIIRKNASHYDPSSGGYEPTAEEQYDCLITPPFPNLNVE